MKTEQLPTRVKLDSYDFLHGSTLYGKTALAIGTLLLLITAGCCSVAWGDLPSGVDRPNVPPNVFAGFMICMFGIPGLFVLLVGVNDLRREAFVRREKEVYPHEPWHWDHPWRPNTGADIGLVQSLKGVFGVLMGIGILLPIHYLLVYETSFPFSIFGFVIVGLFDVILLICLGNALYHVLVQLVHRQSKLTYFEFPLQLGEEIELRLAPASALENVESLTCTLRCIEEQCEARRTGMVGGEPSRGRTVSKVAFELSSEKKEIPAAEIRADEGVELLFQLPELTELRSRLSESPSRHWELIVEGRRPGIDLYKRFLLPVY